MGFSPRHNAFGGFNNMFGAAETRQRMDGWLEQSRGAERLSPGVKSRDISRRVCLGSRARKALNPLIYLAVVFDMELMRPASIMPLGARRFSIQLQEIKGERGRPDGCDRVQLFTVHITEIVFGSLTTCQLRRNTLSIF